MALSKCKLPSPAERERLYKLMEECSEVIQAVSKVLRHGYNSRFPGSMTFNRTTLQQEIGDLKASIVLMYLAKDINQGSVNDQRDYKLVFDTKQWLHEKENIELIKNFKGV